MKMLVKTKVIKRNGEELVQIFVDADACPVVAMALRKVLMLFINQVNGTRMIKM